MKRIAIALGALVVLAGLATACDRPPSTPPTLLPPRARPTPEDEGILVIKSTPEYRSLVDKYGSDHVSVKAVNLDDKDEANFLSKISDGFLMDPGCIIVLKAGKEEGYVYQLDEEFKTVSQITLSQFEEGARYVDARTMEHFYSSLK